MYFGGLNFKLHTQEKDRSVVQSGIESGNFVSCVQFDELYRYGMTDLLLQRMQEGQLRFPPTCNFQIGKKDYDTSVEQPSWADRVLFSQQQQVLKLVHYGSVADYTFSSHRPVLAAFQAKVWTINQEAKAQLEADLSKKFIIMQQNAQASESTKPERPSTASADKASESKSEDAVAEESKSNQVLQADPQPDLIIPEPNLGDLGCLEDEDSQEYDPATLQKIFEEESELNIKNAELIDLISSNSVKMTEEQMREAEG